MEETRTDIGNCYCGEPADKFSSGTPECWKCWNYRKLEGPAARYWARAIEVLFHHNGGSGPDLNDAKQWDKWGITDEVYGALKTLDALRLRYVEQLKAHNEYPADAYDGSFFGPFDTNDIRPTRRWTVKLEKES